MGPWSLMMQVICARQKHGALLPVLSPYSSYALPVIPLLVLGKALARARCYQCRFTASVGKGNAGRKGKSRTEMEIPDGKGIPSRGAHYTGHSREFEFLA